MDINLISGTFGFIWKHCVSKKKEEIIAALTQINQHEVSLDTDGFLRFLKQKVFDRTFAKLRAKAFCRPLYDVVFSEHHAYLPWAGNAYTKGLAEIIKSCLWMPHADKIIQFLNDIRLDGAALTGPVFGIPNSTVNEEAMVGELMRRIGDRVLSQQKSNQMDLLWIGANDTRLIEKFIQALAERIGEIRAMIRIKLVGVRDGFQNECRGVNFLKKCIHDEVEKIKDEEKSKDFRKKVVVLNDANGVPAQFDIVFATHYYQHHDKTQYFVYPIKAKLKEGGLLVWLSAVSRSDKEEYVCEGCEPWNQDNRPYDEYNRVVAFPRAFICKCNENGKLTEPLNTTLEEYLGSGSQIEQNFLTKIRPSNKRGCFALNQKPSADAGVAVDLDIEKLSSEEPKSEEARKRAVYGIASCREHYFIVMVDGDTDDDGFRNNSETDRFVMLYPALTFDNEKHSEFTSISFEELNRDRVKAVLKTIDDSVDASGLREMGKYENKRVFVLKPSSPTDDKTPNMILIFVKTQDENAWRCYYTHLPRKRVIDEGSFKNELLFMGEFLQYIQECDEKQGWTPLLHHTVTRLQTFEGINDTLREQGCQIEKDDEAVFFHKLEGGRVVNGNVIPFKANEGWSLDEDKAFNALTLEDRLKMISQVYAQDVLIFAKREDF